MRCLLNDQRCLSHCLDTSPEWTGARQISARQPWDNVDARPGETTGPSVGKGLRDELRDALLRSEEHTSELQSLRHLVCRLLLEKKKKKQTVHSTIIKS